MKVVMLVGHSSGGIGTHVAHLAHELRVAGDEVVVVGPADTLGRFEVGASRAWWPLARAPRSVLATARGLRRVRSLATTADVVHAHGHQAGLVAALLLAGPGGRRSAGPRLIVSWHNAVLPTSDRAQHATERPLVADDREVWCTSGDRKLTKIPHGRGWRERVQGYVVRRADLVTGASSDLVAEARRLGAREARLATVPSPRVPALLRLKPLAAAERARARVRLLREAGVDADPGLPLVLTVSRVAPQKDLPVLVDAAALLAGECVWVVVGGGDPELARALRDRAAGAPVHLVGPSDDVEGWLRAADAFVLTSRWEARALVIQEAMAAGTPVVTTDVGGLRDLVDGVGTLVPVGDAAGLARATRELLSDPDLRAERADRGRTAAAHLPGVDDMTREWRACYTNPSSMT